MKHNFLKTIWIIGLITLIGSLLGGCAKTADFFSYQQEGQIKYETANKAYLAMDRVKTFNPVISKDKDVYYINKLIYNSLFSLDKNLLAQNDLAESYSFEKGKNRITILIKSGIKWSNGEPLTSSDVKFSIDAYKKASYSKAGIYSSMVKNISSVSLEGNAVTIQYMNGEDLSLENLTFPILPKSKFKDTNDVLKVNEKYIPMGSGPYMVSSYNPYAELILKGNDFYSGIKPENVLTFKVVPSDEQTINLIEPNLISVAFSEKITRDVDFANLNTNIDSYLSNEVEWVGFNMNKAPMTDKRMRQAIATAIDTKTILESSYYGNGVLCDSLYYPEYWGVKNKGSIFKYDLDEASTLLEKAGYKDLNKDGHVEDKYGNELDIKILVNSSNDSRITAANTIKKSLEKIKVMATIVVLDAANYSNAITSGNFDLYIGGGKMAENYDLRSLLKSYNGNPVGYKNPKVDKYLDQLKSGISPEEKIGVFKKVKATLEDEVPYYPLVYKTYGVITSKAFNGTVNPMFNHTYIGAETWTYTYEVNNQDSSK